MSKVRFIKSFITCFFPTLFSIPGAKRLTRDDSAATPEEKYAYACKMIDRVRRSCDTETKYFGIENISSDKVTMFYANHQGNYDALGILLGMPCPCGVLWNQKGNRAFLKWFSNLIGVVDIDLENPKKSIKAIHSITDFVRKGHNILVFPEGIYYTETKNNVQEFKSGCFIASLRTGCRIVPVALYDSWKAMNGRVKGKVVTQVHYLKAIEPEEYMHLKKHEVAELVRSRIVERIAAIEEGQTFGDPVMSNSLDRG